MDLSPAWLIVALVVAAFIVGGLLFAFVADRRRNQEVAHDGERFAPDPADSHVDSHVDSPVDPDRP